MDSTGDRNMSIRGRDLKGMLRTTTNHPVRVTAHTVLATILDVMATSPQLKSMRVNITDKMDNGTSMGLDGLST